MQHPLNAFLGMTAAFFLTGEQDADLLKNINKQDILSLFLSRIHPSSSTRSKLSTHLRSQRPPPPRMSVAAVEAFETSLGKPELKGSWKEAHGGNGTPIVAEFVKYWMDQDVHPMFLATIPDLMAKYPSQRDAIPREGVVDIKDVKAFKKSLEVSEAARALVQWGDLPLSKY